MARIVTKRKVNKVLNFLNNSPIGFAAEDSILEIRGNKEIKIEGCKRILDFSQKVIKILTNKMSIKFSGKHMTIKCITSDSLLITGFINNIEFNT